MKKFSKDRKAGKVPADIPTLNQIEIKNVQNIAYFRGMKLKYSDNPKFRKAVLVDETIKPNKVFYIERSKVTGELRAISPYGGEMSLQPQDQNIRLDTKRVNITHKQNRNKRLFNAIGESIEVILNSDNMPEYMDPKIARLLNKEKVKSAFEEIKKTIDNDRMKHFSPKVYIVQGNSNLILSVRFEMPLDMIVNEKVKQYDIVLQDSETPSYINEQYT